MNGFTRRTKEKMETIEEATISLLDLGIDNIKIADIAAKAMVSQVSIYNYYGSKDKVIKAAFERLMNNQIQCLEKLIETDMPFKEKLEQLLTFKKQTINHLNIYKYSSQDTQFIQFLSSLYSKSSPLFIRFIQMGKKSGDIRENVSDTTLMFYFDMIVQSLTHLPIPHTSAVNEKPIELEILALFLYGILYQNK